MCGIAGFIKTDHSISEPCNSISPGGQDRQLLEEMIWPLRHRGPDGFGFYLDQVCGLAHARLSIIDLEGGWQPIFNEDNTIAVVFNGEIFNYIELKQELIREGHIFRTESDTEVIVHLYESCGKDFPKKLNGQFAIALYDSKKKSLLLIRDRLGIRPLFYTVHKDRLYFASEIKGIFNGNPAIEREFDPDALRQIFTFWTPAGEATPFKGIKQLKPGHLMEVTPSSEPSVHRQRPFWSVPFLKGHEYTPVTEKEAASQLRELLIDAVRLRLRSDVPVGAYLSGGLDSSVITSIIHHFTDTPLETFSITFSDRVYDESKEQQELVRYLDTRHHTVRCDYKTISDVFPDVLWHTEYPLVRTAPAPLYLLSKLVNRHDYKVVLTGEGSDEILGGYDIFKEAKIRRFIAKNPNSAWRPLLLKRLYPYLALSPAKSAHFAKKFFDTEADTADPFYSHRPRWKTTAGILAFTNPELFGSTEDPERLLETQLQQELKGLDPFCQAQHLEISLLLSNYLLSSQGDRMAMAHSVEGRFPFLDHRIVEFAGTLPVGFKMKVLDEKYLLKAAFSDILPEEIVKRKKQPYMAPDILSFFSDGPADYLEFHLSKEQIEKANIFRWKAVETLFNKCKRKKRQGFRENMAFVAILSTQIIFHKFISDFQFQRPKELENTKIVKGGGNV